MSYTRKIDGIVIRKNNIGEADRIITLLTPEGKVAVVARGVRKLTSTKAGALDLFQHVHIVLRESKSLPSVQEVTLAKMFPVLRSNFQAASFAYWAAELVDRLMHDEGAGGNLYQPFLLYLERIANGDEPDPLDARAFELMVLFELGWQPELSACVECRAPLESGTVGWSNRLGGVIDPACSKNGEVVRPMSDAALKALRILSDQGFGVSHRLTMPTPIIQEITEILHHYLEVVGERTWRSPELLKV